jgi:hypothetical protein
MRKTPPVMDWPSALFQARRVSVPFLYSSKPRLCCASKNEEEKSSWESRSIRCISVIYLSKDNSSFKKNCYSAMHANGIKNMNEDLTPYLFRRCNNIKPNDKTWIQVKQANDLALDI